MNALKILESQIKQNTLSHAYLLLGGDNLEQEQLIAKIVTLLKIQNPDIMWVRPAKDGHISIAEIRLLRHQLNLKPHSSPHKIAVILQADNLTAEAANCLLKTLEEPPADSILILEVANLQNVFPTIASRCQKIRLKQAPLAIADDLLQKYNLDKILPASLKTKFEIAKKMAAEPDLNLILNWWLSTLQRLLITGHDVQNNIYAIWQAQKLLVTNVNKQLLLENLFLSFHDKKSKIWVYWRGMSKKLLAKFQTTGKVYQYESADKIAPGDSVLVDTPQGMEVAAIINEPCKGCKKEALTLEKGEGSILRKINSEDKTKLAQLKEQAKKYISQARQKIVEHNLAMKIIDADLSPDEKKLTFYFSAEGRVDFRSLVSDLARAFQKLIRLQQIGPRDEAKILKGIGKCGRELCCAKFLKNMKSVTLDMAQIQQLEHLGTSKITGLCGKLMCCLSYEIKEYQENIKELPAIGSTFKTKMGKGKVTGLNIIKKTVLIQLDNDTKAVVEVNLEGEKV